MKVGKEYTDLAFAVANVHDMGRELSEYGMDNPGSDDKPVVAVRTSKGTKYLMSAEFSMDNLKAFLDGFKAGKLEPYMKSEPVPASNDAGVKVRKAWQLHSIIRRSRYVAEHIEFLAAPSRALKLQNRNIMFFASCSFQLIPYSKRQWACNESRKYFQS